MIKNVIANPAALRAMVPIKKHKPKLKTLIISRETYDNLDADTYAQLIDIDCSKRWWCREVCIKVAQDFIPPFKIINPLVNTINN